MTILITGVAGFIGSHVADRLIAMGHTVVGIDNFNDYYNPTFKEFNIAHHEANPRFSLYRIDLTDVAAMDRVFQNHSFDAIIHLAAQAGVRISIQKPLLAQKANIEATYLLFELARQHNVEEVIFASSSSVYGNQEKVPFSESDPVDLPISPYAASKKACELIAYTYHHLYDISMIGLRFFTVYGERGRPDMSPYLFANWILSEHPIRKFGDGTTRRDYTYIDDIADGVVACLGKKLGYEIINLGNSQTVSLNEYIATFERVTGKTAVIDQQPEQPGDVKQTYADSTKAQELLGWKAKTSLEQGLTNFIKWFKQYRIEKPY